VSKPMTKLTAQGLGFEADRTYRIRGPLRRCFIVLPLLCLVTGCSVSSGRTGTPAPYQNKAALVEELQTAKHEDWTNALDPRVAPSERGDFLDQMNKADRAIKELTHGFEVPQYKIDDALVIPPKSLSAAQRARLIRRLQDAVQQDDHNEQVMLNDEAWSNSAFPADTSRFDQQKELANGVIKDLEIGEDVHWSAIKDALVVPQSPY
jgi:hypothetical protein